MNRQFVRAAPPTLAPPRASGVLIVASWLAAR